MKGPELIELELIETELSPMVQELSSEEKSPGFNE